MIRTTYIIKDPLGIHARPAGELVSTCKRYESSITIGHADKTCDGKKLMALMLLGVKQGDEITLTVEGADEREASKALTDFLSENL